jgi:NAD(P)-dependent dehydrogenase (short-subunit alcohol dehydrogenase family)
MKTDNITRVAVLTGAARGIGAATLDALLRKGYHVAAIDQDDACLRAALSQYPSDRVLQLAADAADRSAIRECVEKAANQFGRIDVAVFNAGVAGPSAPIASYPIEEFDRVLRVNVYGPWHGIQAVVPYMKARGGSIVMTSSINGIRGFATFAGYAASKQAVMGLTRTAAIDLARYAIRINSVHPGLTDTRMMQDVENMVAPATPADARSAFEAFVPLGRYGAPEEVANVIAFLASNEASYVTGAAYIVDGGFTAGVAA